MEKLKIGKYTVTGTMATGVTEEEKNRSIKMIYDAVWNEIKDKVIKK